MIRRCLGERGLPMTRGERIESVRQLTRRGRSADWIASQLDIPERTVVRDRAWIAAH